MLRADAQILRSYRSDQRLITSNGSAAGYLILLAVILYLPSLLSSYAPLGIQLSSDWFLGLTLAQVNYALIIVIGAVGLQLLTGVTGLISLGNAAFFAIGAMAAAIVGVQWDAPFIVAVLAAGAVGGVIGLIVGLPSLRLSGIYLFLGTLALQFLMAYVFLEYQTHNFGSGGVTYPPASVFGFALDSENHWYVLLIIVTALIILAVKNIMRSRPGRALIAIRDHEQAAQAVGVSMWRAKLGSFVISSAIISLGGALAAWYQLSVSADTFSLQLAIDFVAIIVIGGMGSIPGAVLGALFWQLLPQAISQAATSVSSSEGYVSLHQSSISDIALGLLVIFVLLVAPGGLIGLWNSVKRYATRWPLRG